MGKAIHRQNFIYGFVVSFYFSICGRLEVYFVTKCELNRLLPFGNCVTVVSPFMVTKVCSSSCRFFDFRNFSIVHPSGKFVTCSTNSGYLVPS